MRTAPLVALLLTGCASDPYWVYEHEPMLDEVIHTVSRSPWGTEQGWVIREGTTCHIFVVASADRECVLAHERKHCAGYGHPNYRRNLGCPGETLSLFTK